MSHEVHKRFSLLKRHPGLTRDAFFAHYRDVHGPLASSLAGFRRYAYRYVQNHVVSVLSGSGEPPFDGVTQTFQVPRADLLRGFFQTSDYATVRKDEEILFDMARTVSILGREHVLLDGPETASKCLALLATGGDADIPPVIAPDELRRTWPEVRRCVDNALLAASAGALGGTARPFPYDRIVELWLDDGAVPRVRSAGPQVLALLGQRPDAPVAPWLLDVRAIDMFSDPRPPFLNEP
jgi:hypothetical protein